MCIKRALAVARRNYSNVIKGRYWRRLIELSGKAGTAYTVL